ncbi:hypothetical protein [Longirhabdus pacifica]|uniref:hypothetical protein n=1 Tax=Longirhabdus pacifica TaxID=2305227 RepID=UPI0010090769|nr:hypothetical protein [Longirhabdus pacifica]
MNPSKINYDPNLNCYFLTVRGILLRQLDDRDVSLLWNQSGLIYEKMQDNILFTPYFTSLSDSLSLYLNVEKKKQTEEDFSVFLQKIKERILSGSTVLVYSDVFDLPHTLYYQKKHNNHAIEIYHVGNDEVEIVDHYYKFEGNMSISQLKFALEKTNEKNNVSAFEFAYLDTTKAVSPDMLPYLWDTLHFHRKIMNGKDPYDDEQHQKWYGMEAVEAFTRYIHHEVFEDGSNVDISYHGLKEYGGSKNNMAKICLDYGHLLEGLEELGRDYQHIANKVLTIANMILKCFISKNFDHYETRIMNKLQEWKEDEEKATERLNALFELHHYTLNT